VVAVLVVCGLDAIENVVEFLQENRKMLMVLLFGDEVAQFLHSLFGSVV
jgi:hypothetical protein